MTRQRFEELVQAVAARYEGRPQALRRATNVWIVLGLFVMLSWIVLLIFAAILLFATGIIQQTPFGIVLIIIAVCMLLGAIHQAGFIIFADSRKFDSRLLMPGEAPKLIGLLDMLQRKLDCRPFDGVRIGMDMNAFVHETPQLGLLGLSRTTLEIGLPLMMSLTTDELQAVLAHEFTHLSGSHAQSSARIYRLNRTWGNIFEKMQGPATGSFQHSLRGVQTRFIDWYWPRLRARSLVLSRLHEYEADRVAAELSGAESLATALWRMECYWPMLNERFWPDLHAESAQLPEPPNDLMARLKAAFTTPPHQADATRWVGRVLNPTTNHDDTHPSFVDRIKALSIPVDDRWTSRFPEPIERNAAEDLLGDSLPEIAAEQSTKWREGALVQWRLRHRKSIAEARRNASATESSPLASPEPGSANAAMLWESAREAIDVRGVALAEPLIRTVLASDPSHPAASVVLGHFLIGRGDLEGERLLLNVVETRDESWTLPACEVLQSHYRNFGQTDRIRELRLLLDQFESDLNASRLERSTIQARDRFSEHGLTESELAPLLKLLSSTPECESAWLARKDLRYFPKRPLFVLCVRANGTQWPWGIFRSDLDRVLVRRLIPQVELPGQTLIICRQDSFRKLADRIMRIPGSEIYR